MADGAEGLLAVLRHRDGEAFLLEIEAHQLADVLLVLDHQDQLLLGADRPQRHVEAVIARRGRRLALGIHHHTDGGT